MIRCFDASTPVSYASAGTADGFAANASTFSKLLACRCRPIHDHPNSAPRIILLCYLSVPFATIPKPSLVHCIYPSITTPPLPVPLHPFDVIAASIPPNTISIRRKFHAPCPKSIHIKSLAAFHSPPDPLHPTHQTATLPGSSHGFVRRPRLRQPSSSNDSLLSPNLITALHVQNPLSDVVPFVFPCRFLVP